MVREREVVDCVEVGCGLAGEMRQRNVRTCHLAWVFLVACGFNVDDVCPVVEVGLGLRPVILLLNLQLTC